MGAYGTADIGHKALCPMSAARPASISCCAGTGGMYTQGIRAICPVCAPGQFYASDSAQGRAVRNFYADFANEKLGGHAKENWYRSGAAE